MKFILSLLIFCSTAMATQNVVIVLDNSGSMNTQMNNRSTRMVNAKKALNKVIADLPNDTKLGIVLLNGKRWILPLGNLNKNQASTQVDNVKAEGGTPLGECMKIGTDALLTLREKEKYGSYRLLLVTDGEASDAGLVERYLPDILSRGVMVDVIGVGMNQTHSLATKVNNYRKGDDYEQLKKAIAETFAEVSSNENSNDFQIIQNLPDELAQKALVALCEWKNHPIGTTPIKTTAVNPGKMTMFLKSIVGIGIFILSAITIIGLLK